MITTPVYNEMVANLAGYLADYPLEFWGFAWFMSILLMALIILGLGWLLSRLFVNRI